MGRPSKADEGRARACLLAAGVEVASAYVNELQGDGSLIEFPVDAVLLRAGEIWDGSARATGGGFARSTLARHFGSVDGFRAEVMAAIHLADLAGAEHVETFARRLADPLIDNARMPEVRADFTRGDLAAMVESPGRSRQWFELHSRAGRVERYAEILRQTYTGYDRLLRPLLAAELSRRCLKPTDGLEIEDLLVVLTGLTEGVALRVLGDPAVAAERAGEILAAASEAVISGLTSPAGDAAD